MNSWTERKIGEVIAFNPSERIKQGTFAKKIPMDKLNPFTRHIQGYINSEYTSGPKFRNGDTLVAKITPCLENGKTAQVDILEKDEIAFGSSEFIVLRETVYSTNDFIYYFAMSPAFRKKAISCMEGTSGRKRVNDKILKAQILPFPEVSVQKKIATVLSSLDSKIEINNRINAELEAMAKTLYDYWFVQFDFPDANGKPYKTNGGKMVWSKELKREIPAGWKVASLIDIANITMGQSPPGESYNDNCDGAIFFQGCTDFGSRFPSIRLYTAAPTRFAKKGDILLSVRAPVGLLNIANKDCCIGRGLAALRSKIGADAFLFGVMRNLKQIFDRRNVEGTTFGSITKDDLFSLKVVMPADDLIMRYQSTMNAAYEKQNNIESENQQLSSLRDWLLPMLMNGQVRVK